jgi:hypothetical protein
MVRQGKLQHRFGGVKRYHLKRLAEFSMDLGLDFLEFMEKGKYSILLSKKNSAIESILSYPFEENKGDFQIVKNLHNYFREKGYAGNLNEMFRYVEEGIEREFVKKSIRALLKFNGNRNVFGIRKGLVARILPEFEMDEDENEKTLGATRKFIYDVFYKKSHKKSKFQCNPFKHFLEISLLLGEIDLQRRRERREIEKLKYARSDEERMSNDKSIENCKEAISNYRGKICDVMRTIENIHSVVLREVEGVHIYSFSDCKHAYRKTMELYNSVLNVKPVFDLKESVKEIMKEWSKATKA